jgi:hypothetical protein
MTVVLLAVLVGIGAAARSLGVFGTVAVFSAATFCTWLCVVVVSTQARIPHLRVLGYSCALGIAIAAVAGLYSLIGGWALCLAIALTISCPEFITWLFSEGETTQQAAVPAPESRVAMATDLRVAPSALDDEGLCRAWRDSGLALGRARTAQTLLLAEYREACLDEIVRRHPVATLTWLDAGPPDHTDARTYLPPAIDRGRTP